MKEKNYQTVFNHWLKEVAHTTGAFELKHTKTLSLPYSALAIHQEQALLRVANGTLVFKIPDAGYQNPFDCFSMTKQPAYVVIKYPDSFEIITIADFIKERNRGESKSLTYNQARRIAYISVKI